MILELRESRDTVLAHAKSRHPIRYTLDCIWEEIIQYCPEIFERVSFSRILYIRDVGVDGAYLHTLRIYPATMSAMRRLDAMSAILVHIYFFASLPQRTTLTPAGMTNASQIMNAFLTPLNSGMAPMMQASPTIMRAVAANSVTRSFHMPFIAFFISASLIPLSPWWIRIQIFPQIGPNHTAPNIHEPTVSTSTASQLISTIEK